MKLKIICTAALVFVVASAVMGQYRSSEKSRIGVGMSIFNPTGSKLRDIGKNWFGPTIDVNLTFDQFDRPTTFLSIGFFGKDASLSRASTTPITATYIKRFGKDPFSCWYMGGGLGAYLVKFDRYGWPSWVSYKGTNYGCHLMVGREFAGFYFVNFRYDMVSKLSAGGFGDIDFSGWSLSAGTRYTY